LSRDLEENIFGGCSPSFFVDDGVEFHDGAYILEDSKIIRRIIPRWEVNLVSQSRFWRHGTLAIQSKRGTITPRGSKGIVRQNRLAKLVY
jgi:hypothetical protein